MNHSRYGGAQRTQRIHGNGTESRRDYGDNDDDDEHPQLCGPYTCFFCGLPFRQERYTIDRGKIEARAWFCLPECMAGYDWLVDGWSVTDDAQQESRRAYYRKSFGRTVIPAPEHVFHTPDTDRAEWLEKCRAGLSREEQDIADAELRLMDTHRALDNPPVIPDDVEVMAQPLGMTDGEREAASMPEDDMSDTEILMDKMADLVL